MNNNNFMKEETLQLIKEVEDDSSLNQRILSQKLNISLGKTNYLLKELARKGIIKMANFSKNPKKTRKLKYILTPKGLEQKLKLTYHFLQVKERQYSRLKKEYESYVSQAK